MTMHKVLALCLSLLSIAIFSRSAEVGQTENPENQEQRKRFKDIYESIQPLQIYGKVVDQYEHAVAGVEVKIGWENAGYLLGCPDPGQKAWVTSDVNGCWEFSVEKPWRVFVFDARKEGYECLQIDKVDHDLLARRPTKANPVVVRLRKKGGETFLIRRDGPRPLRAQSPHSQTNSLDLMQERPDKLKDDGCADIRVVVNWHSVSNSWSVTFSAPGEGAGVIAGTNLLYAAPPEGYQKALTVGGPPWPRYVYLRSRTPPIFSRLDLEYFPWKGADTNQVFSISYKAWINPFGDRNFEYDERVKKNWRVGKELSEEAKAAIEKGHLFQKPDIEQRIREVKERLEKEKAEKERRLQRNRGRSS